MTDRTLPYPDPDLTDGRVVLRRWTMDDLGCIEEASSDPQIPEGTTVPAVYSADEGRAFIERQWGRQTKGEGLSLAIADPGTGGARGLIVLMLRRMPGTAEIGYWLVPSARGEGRGSSAVRLMARWGVTDGGLHRIQALVMPGNEGSCRVLEKAGFRPEGVLRSLLTFDGRRSDALSYSLLPTDLED